jgi:tetratricopeptide (TPR) repeat protein
MNRAGPSDFAGARRAALALLFACSSVACARTPGAEMERRVEIAERESEPERLLARARAFAQIGDFTRAEQYIDAARLSGAESDQVLPLLLEVCIKDKRYRSAVQHTQDYLRKRPRAYRVRFMLATLYVGLAEADAARREFERVLREEPNHAAAHYMLALVLRDDLGHLGEADLHFREYLRLEPRGTHAEDAESALLQRVP